MLKRVTILSPFAIFLSSVLAIGCFHPDNSFAAMTNEGTRPIVIESRPADLGTPAISAAAGVSAAQDEPEATSSVDDNEECAESGGRESSQQSSLDAAMDLIQTAHDYWVDGDEEKPRKRGTCFTA